MSVLSDSGLATGAVSSATGISTFGDSGVLLPFVMGSVTGVSGVFSSLVSFSDFASATSVAADSGTTSAAYETK